jgi:hypothetical protein
MNVFACLLFTFRSAKQPVAHKPLDASGPGLIGIPANLGGRDLQKLAGRDIPLEKADRQYECADLLHGAGHDTVSAERAGDLEIAAVASMDQPGIRYGGLGGSSVNHFVFSGRSEQISQEIADKDEAFGLRWVDAAARPFKARIDQFQVENRNADRRGGLTRASGCGRWLRGESEKKYSAQNGRCLRHLQTPLWRFSA